MKRTSCTAINFRLPFFHFNAQLTTSLLELRDNAFVEHIENSGFGHLWKHSSFVLIKQASLPTKVHYIFLFTETESFTSRVLCTAAVPYKNQKFVHRQKKIFKLISLPTR